MHLFEGDTLLMRFMLRIVISGVGAIAVGLLGGWAVLAALSVETAPTTAPATISSASLALPASPTFVPNGPGDLASAGASPASMRPGREWPRRSGDSEEAIGLIDENRLARRTVGLTSGSRRLEGRSHQPGVCFGIVAR
jgi:hypothetical protein